MASEPSKSSRAASKKASTSANVSTLATDATLDPPLLSLLSALLVGLWVMGEIFVVAQQGFTIAYSSARSANKGSKWAC